MHHSDPISLQILTAEKTLMEKHVSKVTLPGSKGPFMVLRNHAPLISSLEEGDVVMESEGGQEIVHVMSGFVEVNDNNVTICAEV